MCISSISSGATFCVACSTRPACGGQILAVAHRLGWTEDVRVSLSDCAATGGSSASSRVRACPLAPPLLSFSFGRSIGRRAYHRANLGQDAAVAMRLDGATYSTAVSYRVYVEVEAESRRHYS